MTDKEKHPETFYRYETYQEASYNDEYGHASYGSVAKIRLNEYKLVRVTPRGYWIIEDIHIWNGEISDYNMKHSKKWIPKKSRKRYAYPTKEEAIESFMIRMSCWKQHLESKHRFVERSIMLGDIEKQKLKNEEKQPEAL